MRSFALATALSLFSAASAATITVLVGENGGLTYNPPNVTAAEGDEIAFQFMAKNHTVTQSTFKSPCTLQKEPAEGINSGYQAVAANATEIPQWSFTVDNATSPLWFYCAQPGHCGKGMVFSVNAPAVGNTHEKFVEAAKASGASGGTSGGASGSGDAGTPTNAGDAATQSGGAAAVFQRGASSSLGLIAAGLTVALLV
ncbi:hypothetical protein C8J57DRAFT_504837 [Mycena rebaudengoi]|nr:hypothetical protein C8J57DRAFT_504837 [Mycena rebaudengoi]